jgi:hypothetical protein
VCHEHDSDENFPENLNPKIFWKNIAENFPYGKIFHLTSLVVTGRFLDTAEDIPPASRALTGLDCSVQHVSLRSLHTKDTNQPLDRADQITPLLKKNLCIHSR